MTLKRTVTIDASTPSQVTKRLKKVERKQNLYGANKLSYHVISGTATTADGAVTAVKIEPAVNYDGKFVRVTAKGSLGGEKVDVYLVQTPTVTAPVYTDFAGVIGGCLVDASAPDGKGLALWKHYLSLNGGVNFSMVQKFKYGFVANYNESASVYAGKQLYFVIKNDSGASVTTEYCIELYFNGSYRAR